MRNVGSELRSRLGGLVQHASSSSDSDSDSDTNNGKAPTTTVTSTSKVVSAEEEARGQAPVVEVETMPSDFFDAAPTPSDDGGAAESGVAGEDDTPSTSNPNGTASAAVTAEDEECVRSVLPPLCFRCCGCLSRAHTLADLALVHVCAAARTFPCSRR